MRTIHVRGWNNSGRIDEDIDIAVESCATVADCTSPMDQAFVRSHAEPTSEGEARCERVRTCIQPEPIAVEPRRPPPTRTPIPSAHAAASGGCSVGASAPSWVSLVFVALIAGLSVRRALRVPRERE